MGHSQVNYKTDQTRLKNDRNNSRTGQSQSLQKRARHRGRRRVRTSKMDQTTRILRGLLHVYLLSLLALNQYNHRLHSLRWPNETSFSSQTQHTTNDHVST